MEPSYDTIPAAHMVGAVRRYLEQGLEPGGFLRALLSNDLRGAVMRADGVNVARIPEWVAWLENNMPTGSWGSPEAYDAWLEAARG